ncbi:MAG TPA: peptidoglycan-binding protein LysM [Pseudobdellovibrionaceae bacterium]|jgi:nucleoid-associated protein YgaU
MGLINFLKNAGEKLLGHKEADVESIKKYIQSQGLSTEGIDISFDPAKDIVTVSGEVPDQATKEKILLCCGNVQGVASVQDNLRVRKPAPESQFYTVQSGDTLSKIAARFYGDAKKYSQIFDANRPMLSDPDKIYPGQNLRIPSQAPAQEKVAEHHP